MAKSFINGSALHRMLNLGWMASHPLKAIAISIEEIAELLPMGTLTKEILNLISLTSTPEEDC
jgi:hypothetical protein